MFFFFYINANNVNFSLIIAFQFFKIGTAYSAGNIFDRNYGEYNSHLPFIIFYDSGSYSRL